MSSSVPSLKIRMFNPEILNRKRESGKSPTILVVGKRCTGKSTLIKDILSYLTGIPMFIAMSGTEDGNGFYSEFIHPLCVHNEYKPTITAGLLRQQKARIQRMKKANLSPAEHRNADIGLLLDDCGYDKNIMHQKDMRTIFMNGRHWQITMIVSLQYVMGIPPELRTNIDYVFCLRENIINNQKRLYDNFFGCFKKFAEFQEVFAACTNNHECLVLDNTSTSTDLSECLYYYKAVPDRQFRMGPQSMWNYLDSIYNRDYENEPNETASRRASTISLKKAPMDRVRD